MKYIQKISVSVIVPVYNVEKYLRDCLESLLYQTESFDEIVLVNDGSTDDSRKICEEYCKQNCNMILIDQGNQGLSSARNAGLKYAKGDYIVFVDSDDFIALDMNERIQKILLETGVDILYYNANVIDELQGDYTEQLVRSEFLNNYIMQGIEYLEKCFPDDYRCSACLAAYKKDFLDKFNIFFPYGLYYEDNIFFIKSVLKARKVLCISDCLYFRRIRNDSIMTGAMNEKKSLDHIAINILIWKELINYPYKNLHLQFYRRYISIRMISSFHFLDKFMHNKAVNQKMYMMMKTFVQMWIPFYESGILNWDDAYAMRLVYNFLLDTAKDGYVDNCLECKQLNGVVYRTVEQILGELPLKNMHKRVGIYGIGKSTQALIKLYQRYIGEISCELFFIVTEKKIDTFMGRRVVIYREIPEGADVIVSSRIYQDEMLNVLLENNIERERIITIYDSNMKHMSDMVMFAEIDD